MGSFSICVSLRCFKICVFLVTMGCMVSYWYLHRSNTKIFTHLDSGQAVETSRHLVTLIQNASHDGVLAKTHPISALSREMTQQAVNYLSSSSSSPSLKNESSFSLPKSKVILLWTPFFGSWSFIPHGQAGFQNCPISSCLVTTNRSNLLESSAILFHARDLSLTDLPLARLPHQQWIYYCLESPIYSYFSGFHFMQRMFNWTMTYRLDSDIRIKYGHYKKEAKYKRNNQHDDMYRLWMKKKGMVVWMVSHCSTSSRREQFVRELQKYIDVDVFGLCGVATCPRNMTKECLKRFEEKYMFILALENAICKDYVTEKLFDALHYNMIPIVLGGADYQHIAPPNSVIDASKFPSPKLLADYLHTVARDFNIYLSYLSWKNDFNVYRFDDGLCDLCAKLHEGPLVHKTYADLKHWWVNLSNCHSWKNTSR